MGIMKPPAPPLSLGCRALVFVLDYNTACRSLVSRSENRIIGSMIHIITDIHLTGKFIYKRKMKCEIESAVRSRPREHQQRFTSSHGETGGWFEGPHSLWSNEMWRMHTTRVVVENAKGFTSLRLCV